MRPWLAFAVVLALVVADVADAAWTANSTAYCLSGTMADGTGVRPGSAASNRHPLGTKLTLLGTRGPDGRRRYVVRDRIGHGSELDLWTGSCAQAIQYGRRVVRYRLGWSRPRARATWRLRGKMVRS